MIKCPNCTGELDFNVKDKVIKCSYCGSTFNPAELKTKVKMAGESKKKEDTKEEKKEPEGNYIVGNSYTCSQCGAELMTFDETAVTFCSYCGSQAMIESRMIKQNAPDFIIPFSKDKDECVKAYKRKVSKALFAPDYMKKDTTVEKFRGIFMPYVVYKLAHHGQTHNSGSKYSHRSGDYIIYNDYSISANVEADYSGLSYDLMSRYYDKYSHAIPFNFKEKVDFNPNYLVGFYADTKDVDSSIYVVDAENIADADLTKKMLKHKEFIKYGCSNPKATVSVEEKKVGLFPVYFLAMKDKSGKNVNYAVVNGQTGKVAVDLPVSFAKYIIFSLIVAIAIFLLINKSLVLKPSVVCFIALLFGVFNLIVSCIQIGNIKKARKHRDDKGYLNKNPLPRKKKKERDPDDIRILPYIYKEIIGSLIPLFILFTGTIDDTLYYGAALIGFVLIILSFRDLVKEHNIMVSSKLPQLEKRGGDENA